GEVGMEVAFPATGQPARGEGDGGQGDAILRVPCPAAGDVAERPQRIPGEQPGERSQPGERALVLDVGDRGVPAGTNQLTRRATDRLDPDRLAKTAEPPDL